jgi:two-component system cell cycle sensor histidine kinase PleC
LNLINEILDLSRIEAGRYELNEEAVSLNRVVEDCHHLLKLRAGNRGLTIHEMFEPDMPRLWADERAVRQICLNLLSNAIKFTPANGRVMVRGAPVDDGWEVEVSDTGVGIPPDEQALLFSRFFRASNARSGGLDGRGLGLSIAKAIVDLHRGQITVNTALGSGTTIRVVLRAVAGAVAE